MRDVAKWLEMRARKAAPGWSRRAWRLYRAAASAAWSSQPLPAELLADCRFCASRLDLLARIDKGGIAAEIGTYKGDFARHILALTDPAKLHVIDIDYSNFDQALLADPRLVRHEGLSQDIIGRFSDRHFDWIYVDADHSYEGTLRDAEAARAKLRHGGLLIFNDFAHIDPYLGRYGVHRAVVDFAVTHRWPFHLFSYDGAGLYDVALRNAPVPSTSGPGIGT